jgi:hypothetical protein
MVFGDNKRMTLEALGKLSEEFEEEFRFMPLIQFLEGSNPDGAVLTCLSLINFIVDSIDDLEERFQTRMEFMTMGFKDILANLPRGFLFEIQKANFDTQTKNDYEDMVCRKQAASSAKVIISSFPYLFFTPPIIPFSFLS